MLLPMGETGEQEEARADAYEQCARLLDKIEESDGFDARAFRAEYPRHAERLRQLLARIVEAGPDGRQAASRPAQATRSASFVSAGSDITATVLRRLLERAPESSRFEHEEEVARGGQGAILRVWDEDLGRHLAMKLAHDSASGGSAKPEHSRSIGRFLEEARITAQLDHPGIVPVHDLGTDARGHVYFTMKLVKGRDLKEVFALVAKGEEGWNLTRALHVLLRVCEGMAYAHSKGVIHRDLKPGNVMVGRFGEVYVMDWGLARVMGQEDGHDVRIQPPMTTTQVHSLRHVKGSDDGDSPLLTMDGDVVGTPAYMSPEQANGDLPAMGPHSDVYSAGAMLYHLLAGHPPYVPPGMRAVNYAIWVRVQEGPPPPLHERAPDAPAELLAICEKAMARDAKKRYADMSGLAEDLRAFLERRVVHAYETGAVAELKKWVVRNRAQAGTAAAAVVLVVAALVAALGVRTSERDKALASERRAQDSALHAKEQEQLAKESAEEARKQAQRASDERANVMRLSAFQDLEELKRRADELWPITPERAEQYRAWLADARTLLAGIEPDAASGSPGHAALLRELRSRAQPQSEAEHAAALSANPRHAELIALDRRRSALRRALDIHAGRQGFEVPVVDPTGLPVDATKRADRLWDLVKPDRTEFGREAEAMELAQQLYDKLVFEQPGTDQFVRVADTLAWAHAANGLTAEALEISRDALEQAEPTEKAAAAAFQAKLEAAIHRWEEHGADELTLLDHLYMALDSVLSGLRFDNHDDGWWHDRVAKLILDLGAFADPLTGLVGGSSPEHGWGIERRLDFATKVEERSRTGDEARKRWREAIDSIADPEQCPAYDGLRIDPQLGLLPLGRDPQSKLWEFAHLETGEPPVRNADGRFVLEAETGLVFVLIPGGTFLMGAQKFDSSAPGYDPYSIEFEYPPHTVEIEPFFLSKYEMTQAQWAAFTMDNPSAFAFNAAGVFVFRNPVESVSWDECQATLARLGLELPTEAQWERAARAGTTSPWWAGDKEADLDGAANVVDLSAAGAVNVAAIPAPFDDGFSATGDVDALRPNQYGLYGIVGNVIEWCRDAYRPDFYAKSPQVEPLCDDYVLRNRVGRGGSHGDALVAARSAFRYPGFRDTRAPQIGVRPARKLDR